MATTMPTRVTTGEDMANRFGTDAGGNERLLQSRTSSTPRMDDMGVGAEQRAIKRFQNGTSDGNIALHRPIANTSVRSTTDAQPNTGTRRRPSIRDKKPTPGGSPQSSPSKRFAYDNHSNPYTSQRSNAPSSRPDSHTKQPSINSTSRFSFSSVAPNVEHDETNVPSSFDFLPSVNFDDLQTSLATEDPGIYSFPSPGGGGIALMGNAKGTNGIDGHSVTSGNPRSVEPVDFGSRIGRSGSFVRRQNSSARAGAHALGEPDAVGPPITSAAAKTRRKSLFPGPTANVPIPRTARKSVGPGILPSDLGGQSFSRRRQTMVHTDSVVVNGPTDLLDPVGNEGVSRAQDSGDTEGLRTPAMGRDARVKSMQPKPRWAQDQSLTSLNTPPTASISTARSPARSTGQRTNTPSSSTKRLSMMPNTTHATGLGARTISPTDARRMKRLSIMPNPPPMPYTPPTPQPDPPYYTGTRSAAQSPSMIPRKNVTPSSNRTTPDPNRKSYSSGISNSSSTSYNSFLNSTGSLRISQNLSGSRLPTPKARNEGEATGAEEVVPPVPAIPKAYESPKTEFEAPYFVGRKSSLPSDASSASTSTADGESYHTADNALPKVDRETWQRRGPTIEASSGTEKKANSGTNNNRRTLQPLRLPPLNLLPLSTPTTEKINALYDLSAMLNPGAITPPPKLGNATTPSTPMTASKASFFSRSRHNDDAAPMQAQMRSSSSHHTMRKETSSYYEPSNSSNSISTPVEPQTHRTSRMTRSPFISSSLPKSSGDFDYLRQKEGESNSVDGAAEIKSSRLTGPRSQKSTKAIQDQASSMELPSPTGATTPSFGNNLRRKLSLTRKRSSSKTPADSDAELPPKPPKHDHMPPPKLPASATWSGPFLPSPSPTQHTNYLQSRRKPSGSNNTIHHDRSRSGTWTTESSPKKDPMPPDYSAVLGPKRTLRSALEGGSRANGLALKDFLQEAKTLEVQLDRDDLSAEDEMKRLASKRKETEIAAREMDVLRRRATAKERVGPMQALRMAHLNIFERGEVVDFKDVYFCGTQNAKKHVGDLSTESTNFGYDDERGDYCIVRGDHLAYRYEIVDILGKGSFGQVARCVDHKTGGLVAIKIIRNKKRFHQQALVEVEILRKLREWDPGNKHSMVNFTQSFYFRSHLCISTELLGMNLYEFIKCHDFRGFSLKLIRRFTKQLLSSLVLLKAHKVIHCDLKPENVLLAHPARAEIKVIDFGSSCLEHEKVYTYIQSRFYRSPEVILGMTYGMPIDMWSLGCILAELLTGYPIFPGENEQEQLACIMEVFGPPEKHLIEKSTRKKLFFDSLGKPRLTVSSKGKRRRPSSKSLQQALKCEDESFLDFITMCLRWDPDRRLKPDEAIHHEFVSGKKPSSSRTMTTRPPLTTANSSPVKRYNSMTTPAGIRPLPEPPATSFKNGTAVRNRDMPSNSPIKSTGAAPKRHSTVNGMQSSAGVKRTANGAAITGSALPRVAQRVGSGKVDLAAAGAAAALVSGNLR